MPLNKLRDRHGLTMGRRALPSAIQTASQGVSSVNNLVLTMAIVTTTSLQDLGQFNLPFTLYLMALGLHRSMIVEPVLAALDKGVFVAAQRFSLGVSTVLGVTLLLIGFLADRPLIAVVGIFVPFMLLMDLRRNWAIISGRPQVSLLMDVIWLAGTASIFVLPVENVIQAVVLWGASCAVSLLAVSWLPIYRSSDPREARTFRNAARGISKPSTMESLIYQFGWQLPVAASLDALSAEAAGQYRLVITIMAPLGVVVTSWTLSTYRAVRSTPNIDAVVRKRVSGIAAVSISYQTACLILREPLSLFAFGEEEAVSMAMLAVVGLQVPLLSVAGQYAVWFKINRRGRELLISRAISTIPALGLVGAAVLFSAPVLAAAAITAALLTYGVCVFVGYHSHRSEDRRKVLGHTIVSEVAE
ncbi:hypothetical protein [Kocuria arenosa]|uniref:hypothetical protein n=1 Tax=Kocuria arenosa TaxID=3071446 RepID=UPI0034D59F94